MSKFMRNRVKKCHTEESLLKKAAKKAAKETERKRKEEQARVRSVEEFEKRRTKLKTA